MDGKGFQVLVAQLSDLSGVQRAALITALKRRLPADEALQLIDTHFLADPCCGHCRSKNVGGWSAQGGLKRYRCKDCGKTFNALTGTPLAQLHRRDAWFAYAQALADGVSLRRAGRAAYGQFADQAGLLHIALNASKGERMYGSYHIQNVNAYISRLKDWLRRFKGVATHHLPTYLGWRRMIEREGDLTPARIVMQATPQAPTSN